ncbi:MAG: tetratricopeptide repeat protein [Ignavibacteria bacterium]|nr:tetratricopeptide repeat protein [Ignavibacteria bacterium]
MLAKKKKISKKEMKEDKLVTLYYNSMQYFEKYQKQILIGVAAVAAAGLLVYFYITNNQTKNTEASKSLAKIIDIYEAGMFNEAIEGRPGTDNKGLKYIAEEFGGSENGETARIYLANSYYNIGDIDKALEQYEDYSGDNEMFSAAAYSGMAACYVEKKDYQKAAEYFIKASKVNSTNPQNSAYLLEAGINYLKIGDKESAKEALNTIKEEHKTTQEFTLADRYLAQCI